MTDTIVLNPNDMVNLIQRQAVELARVLDVPNGNVSTKHICDHVKRMLSLAVELHDAVAKLEAQAKNGAEHPNA